MARRPQRGEPATGPGQRDSRSGRRIPEAPGGKGVPYIFLYSDVTMLSGTEHGVCEILSKLPAEAGELRRI